MDEKIEQIFHAIKMTVEELKSQAELARKCGVHKSFINKYITGKVKTLEMEMFFKLYPHIRKHLPGDFFAVTECEKICGGLGNMGKGFIKDLKMYSSEEKTKLWKFNEDIQEERLKNKTVIKSEKDIPNQDTLKP